jgi:hypothetical protein
VVDDPTLANQVVTELSTNPLTTFVALMDKAVQQETDTGQQDKDKDKPDGTPNGVVLGEGQCKP